jgi:hypothetical protein
MGGSSSAAPVLVFNGSVGIICKVVKKRCFSSHLDCHNKYVAYSIPTHHSFSQLIASTSEPFQDGYFFSYTSSAFAISYL